ncbi:MAG TPA: SDR family NAD(P)-dependent oxidoreductase [Pantanalinema sp.]
MKKRSGSAMGWLVAAGAAYLGWRLLARRAPESLDGQVVLITGGSRGLGLLLAREFARQGCRIAICARDEAELERARRDLEARGAEVLAVPCDVADRAQAERLVAITAAHYGAIDVLVNNAGIIQVGPVETMTFEDFERIMAVNFFGALHTTLAVLPRMRARRCGKIVTIDSIGGRVSSPHLLPYHCAKFALRGFSEGLRVEVAKDGIAVTTVLPGLMRTGSPVNACFKGQQAKEFIWFALADSWPGLSQDAERSARKIVEATRKGVGEVTLSWQALLLGIAHDVFPNLALDAFALLNRLLPGADGAGTAAARGMDLEIPRALRLLFLPLEREAARTNQLGGEPEGMPARSAAAGQAKEPEGRGA